MTYENLKAKICADMGGRAAEEIIFGDITTGASADIVQATNIARKMITEWGMSKSLGFVNYGSDREVFIGRDYQTTKTYSEAKACEIDKEIHDLLAECYERTINCLKENREALDNMSNLLIEKETIYAEEVELILQGKDYKEIIKIINKKRKEAEEAQAKRMQELKEQAAQALTKAGVLSEEELKMIKGELNSTATPSEKSEAETTTEIESESENTESTEEKADAEQKVEDADDKKDDSNK